MFFFFRTVSLSWSFPRSIVRSFLVPPSGEKVVPRSGVFRLPCMHLTLR